MPDFQFISDIHLETRNITDFSQLHQKLANNIILAGDIGNPYSSIYQDYIKYLSNNYKNVFVLSGNHEYHNMSGMRMKTISEIDLYIFQYCCNFSNVFYINKKVCKIRDTIIIAATLWTIIPNEFSQEIMNSVSDYKKVSVNSFSTISSDDVNKLHAQQIKFINLCIKKYENMNNIKSIIVVSHYPPVRNFIPDKFTGCVTNYAYTNNLHYYIKSLKKVKYWICGHTHVSKAVQIGNVKIMSNCLGYPTEYISSAGISSFHV